MKWNFWQHVFFYVTMLEIHNFKLTVTLTIVKNSDNCTKY
jgi:hypothetical protein